MATAQARYTATREVTVQAGAALSVARPDYGSTTMRGAWVFADLDTTRHLGAELGFRQVNLPGSIVYERSYEAGIRYSRPWRGAEPYLKGMYGRGVFNFPPYAPPADQHEARANLAYNLFTAGAGVDLSVQRRVFLRADLTYQRWLAGNYPTAPLPGAPGCPFLCRGMQPVIVSVGAAFRFSGTGRR